jgi:N6-L-threonylcarbamoyladenine synthase
MLPVIRQALREANVTLADVDAVAVTHGPGLAGSLLVGVNAAKGLALGSGKPLLGINHLEGHIYTAWLYGPDPEKDAGFPLLCLIASGGHTDLYLMEGHGRYTVLGRTRDDAAGEAFDKAARILGLGFPGGPEIQKAAARIAATPEKLPRAWLKDTDDFSFSGLKTATLHLARERGVDPESAEPNPDVVARLALAFQEAVADVMTTKAIDAARRVGARGIILGGGVTANSMLRQMAQERSPVPTFIPPPRLCTDNGAMIGGAAHFHLLRGEAGRMDVDAIPSLRLGSADTTV